MTRELTLVFSVYFCFHIMFSLLFRGDDCTSSLDFHQNQNRNKSKNSLAKKKKKKSMSIISLLKMGDHTVPVNECRILNLCVEIPVL